MDFKYNNPDFKEKRRELRKNQTDAEKALWRHLRSRQFYGIKFYRQYSVGGYVLDFFSPKLRLAIELDGGQHAEEENKKYDKARTEFLKGQGIEVIRFWNNDVMMNIEGVLREIEKGINLYNPSQPPLMLRGGVESGNYLKGRR